MIKDYRYDICTSGKFVCTENIIWFIPNNISMLFGYDLDKNRIEKVINLENANRTEYGYLTVENNGDYLITAAFNNNINHEAMMYTYNLKNGDLTSDKITDSDNYTLWFYESVCWNNKVYFFPAAHYDKYLIIDLKEGKKELKPLDNRKYNNFYGSVLFSSNLFMINETSDLLCFDLNNEEFSYCTFSNHIFTAIAADSDGKVWLGDEEGRLIVYKKSDNTFKEVIKLKSKFYQMLYTEGSLFVFYENTDDNIARIDLINMNITEIIIPDLSKNQFDRNLITYSKPILYENKIYVMNTFYSKLLEIENDICNIHSMNIMNCPDSEKEKYINYKNSLFDHSYYKFNEDYTLSLEDYLKNIIDRK